MAICFPILLGCSYFSNRYDAFLVSARSEIFWGTLGKFLSQLKGDTQKKTLFLLDVILCGYDIR